MEPIKFNQTADYQYMEVLGVEGVFTPVRIQADTLPSGFHKYSLREGEESFICSVKEDILVDHAGDFIAKEPLALSKGEERVLSEEDWGFTDKDFEFTAYFGQHLHIDTQIALAEAKREQQSSQKQKGKSSRDTPDKEDHNPQPFEH